MQYLINKRNYSAQHPLDIELKYTPLKNYLFDLDYLSTIAVEGEKALEFLQGQVSCDTREVTATQIRQGVMCNLKGRVMAALDIVLWDNQGISLVVPEDLCVDTIASLAKPALFSRVEFRQNSLKLYGLFVQSEEDLIPLGITLPKDRFGITVLQNSCCYKLAPSFYILMVKTENADKIFEPFIAHKQDRGSLAWHALQLQQDRFEIYPESRGLFLPHRLNMHQSGYLSFEKGCYKGQEIIARMHYRSKVKHQIIHFDLKTNKKLRSGMELYNEQGGLIVGELVDYCPIGDDRYIAVGSVLIDYFFEQGPTFFIES